MNSHQHKSNTNNFNKTKNYNPFRAKFSIFGKNRKNIPSLKNRHPLNANGIPIILTEVIISQHIPYKNSTFLAGKKIPFQTQTIANSQTNSSEKIHE